MTILAITDIPRIISLFEQFEGTGDKLLVVNELPRGLELFDEHKPACIIIQSHICGLSAEIISKHLSSRTVQHKVRFILIQHKEHAARPLPDGFEAVLDPSLTDRQFMDSLTAMISWPGPKPPVRKADETTVNTDTVKPEKKPARTDALPVAEPAALPVTETIATNENKASAETAEGETPDIVRIHHVAGVDAVSPRPSRKITSPFSQYLDNTAEDELPEKSARKPENEENIRETGIEPDLISDAEESKPFFYSKVFWLISGTVAAAFAITLYQQSLSGQKTGNEVQIKPEPVVSAAPKAAPVTVTPPAKKPEIVAQPAAAGKNQAVSAVAARLKTLPGFIPKAGFDPSFGKVNKGWESYRGITGEYRIFRDRDSTIKAVQVIDRSGTGIQETLYNNIMKELVGSATASPAASEVQEGYEIRRSTVAGLKQVQYRDVQGGRLRGFVITWP